METNADVAAASLQKNHVYCDRSFYSHAIHWFLAEPSRAQLCSVESPTQASTGAPRPSDGQDPPAKRQKRTAEIQPVRRQPPRKCKTPRPEQSPLPTKRTAEKKRRAKQQSVAMSESQASMPGTAGGSMGGTHFTQHCNLLDDTHRPDCIQRQLSPSEFIVHIREAVQSRACALRAARHLPDPGHEIGHDLVLNPCMPADLTPREQLRQLEERRFLYPPAHLRRHRCALEAGIEVCGKAEDRGTCLHGRAMDGLRIVDGDLEMSKAPEAEMVPSPSLGRWPDFTRLPVEDMSTGLVQTCGLQFFVDVCEPVTRILMLQNAERKQQKTLPG